MTTATRKPAKGPAKPGESNGRETRGAGRTGNGNGNGSGNGNGKHPSLPEVPRGAASTLQ